MSQLTLEVPIDAPIPMVPTTIQTATAIVIAAPMVGAKETVAVLMAKMYAM